MKPYDVIVVGGGAAGMMAAGRAAQLGRRVLLVEKNQALGEKLSITGGGRCNITNAEYDNRILLVNYGDAEKFLYSTFSRFAVEQTFSLFESGCQPLLSAKRCIRLCIQPGQSTVAGSLNALSHPFYWVNGMPHELFEQ